MPPNNSDDADDDGSQPSDSAATGDEYDSRGTRDGGVTDPESGNFSQYDSTSEDNITTDPSEVESTWTPTEGPDPSELDTQADFPDDPEINADSIGVTTTDSEADGEVDRDDTEGSKKGDTAESADSDTQTSSNDPHGSADTDTVDKRETDTTSAEKMDTTDTADTMDSMDTPGKATESNDEVAESGDVPAETPQQGGDTESVSDREANVEGDIAPDTDSDADESSPPVFESKTGASAASVDEAVESADGADIGSEPSIDPATSAEQPEPSIQQADSETQHTDPVDDVPLKHGDSFEEEPPSFVVEKTLVLLTVVVIAIAVWSLSLQFVANLPVPGVTIAVGLLALWAVFLLTIGRYVADFGLWFAAL